MDGQRLADVHRVLPGSLPPDPRSSSRTAQWSDGYNSNSDAYNVNAGQTLQGELVYEPSIDSYNLTQLIVETVRAPSAASVASWPDGVPATRTHACTGRCLSADRRLPGANARSAGPAAP